jgi:hypothetical protein
MFFRLDNITNEIVKEFAETDKWKTLVGFS